MSYWEILGLNPTENGVTLYQAYLKRLKELDPDADIRKFHEVGDAYNRLAACGTGVIADPAIVLPVEPNGEPQVVLQAAWDRLYSNLLEDFGASSGSVYERLRREIETEIVDGVSVWNKLVFGKLAFWQNAPFPGLFAKQFGPWSGLYLDSNFQNSHAYAVFLFEEKGYVFDAFRKLRDEEPKNPGWRYLLSPRIEAVDEIPASLRSLLLRIEDEYIYLILHMFYWETLVYWRKKIRA